MQLRGRPTHAILALLTAWSLLSCAQKKTEVIYIPIEKNAPVEQADLKGDPEPSMTEPRGKAGKGGGVVDGSGGELIYASQEQVQVIASKLAENLKIIFHRVDMVYHFSAVPEEKSLADSKTSPPLPQYQKILKDMIIGNPYQAKGIIQNLDEQALSFHVVEEPCLGSLEKDASINDRGEICINLKSFLKIPADSVERQLLALIIHETVHYYGFEEHEAVLIQRFFLEDRGFIFDQKTADSMLSSFQDPLSDLKTLFAEISSQDNFNSCPSLDDIIKSLGQDYYMFRNQVLLPRTISDHYETYASKGVVEIIPSCLNSEFSSLAETEKIRIYATVLPDLFLDLRFIEDELTSYIFGPKHQQIPASEESLMAFQYYLNSASFLKIVNQQEPKKLLAEDVSCSFLRISIRDELPALESIKTFSLSDGHSQIEIGTLHAAVELQKAPEQWLGQLLTLTLTDPSSPDSPVFLDYSRKGSVPLPPNSLQGMLSWNYSPHFTVKFADSVDSDESYYLHCAVQGQ